MSGKVYSIMSLIPQNGAKYIAFNLGFFTKRKFKNKKVLLIDFDFDNPTLGYHYVKKSIYSIDNLMPIKNNLNADDFTKNITQTRFNVDVLKGSSLGDVNYISKELIVKILNLSKEIYDYVFVVNNLNVSNPALAITLLNSEKVILVVKNNYSNLLKIDSALELINTFVKNRSNIKIVANFNNYNQGINILNQIKDFNYRYLSLLDFVPKSIDNKNLQNRFFIKRKTINDRKFKEIISRIIVRKKKKRR